MTEFLGQGDLCRAEDPGNIWAFGGPPKQDPTASQALERAVARFEETFKLSDRGDIIFIGPSVPLSPTERRKYL